MDVYDELVRLRNLGQKCAIATEFAAKLLSAMRYQFGGHVETGSGKA